MSHLVPCPECSRHVRVTEVACPFCALPLDLASSPEPQLPRARLSRAATFAFGATLASASALAACSSDNDDGVGSVVPVYGAPAGGTVNSAGSGGAESGASSGGSAHSGGATVMPVYGAPAGGAFPTAGSGGGPSAGSGGAPSNAGSAGEEAGAGGSDDSGGGGGPVPVYGGPPA